MSSQLDLLMYVLELWGILQDLCSLCSENNVSLLLGMRLEFLFPMIPLAKLHIEFFIDFVRFFAAQLENIWIISLPKKKEDIGFHF